MGVGVWRVTNRGSIGLVAAGLTAVTSVAVHHALTTADDCADQVQQVRSAAVAAGRAADAVSISVQVQRIAFGGAAEVRRAEEEICADWGHIPHQSLAANPYVLLGEPQQMADALMERQERFSLNQIVLQEQTDPLIFCRQVLPLLPQSSSTSVRAAVDV